MPGEAARTWPKMLPERILVEIRRAFSFDHAGPAVLTTHGSGSISGEYQPVPNPSPLNVCDIFSALALCATSEWRGR
jgi:hypothetical protein